MNPLGPGVSVSPRWDHNLQILTGSPTAKWRQLHPKCCGSSGFGKVSSALEISRWLSPTSSLFICLTTATDISHLSSVQLLSHIRLCNPMDCSTPGLPLHRQLPELAQTHAHRVGDAIQPSHPLSFPSLPTFNLPASGSLKMSQFFASGGRSHLRAPVFLSFGLIWRVKV